MAAALDLRDELDALTKSLDAANVPYAVCGALALAIHGQPRATKAIDLVVDPEMSPASIERRLREVSRLSPLTFEPLPRVSMAPEAVEERLRGCAEMSRVCWDLARADRAADRPAP